MKKNKVDIKVLTSMFKSHLTVKKTLLINDVEIVTYRKIDQCKYSIYFNKDATFTAYTIYRLNKFLIDDGIIKNKFVKFRNFLNSNSYLRNYKNYRVLDFTRYF